MNYQLSFDWNLNRVIRLSFNCDICGMQIQTGDIKVPPRAHDDGDIENKSNEIDKNVTCWNCSKVFTLNVRSGLSKGYVNFINYQEGRGRIHFIGLQEPAYYAEDEADAAMFYTGNHYAVFKNEIENLRALNDLNPGDFRLNKLLKKQIYSGAVTCMEAYLSDAYISATLSDDDFLKKFVKYYAQFKEEKFALNTVFEVFETIKDRAKTELLSITFHNLPKIKEYYVNTFQILFPNIKEPYKIVLVRHDLVHRNGKTKDGTEIEVDKEIVFEALNTIDLFVTEISTELSRVILTKP